MATDLYTNGKRSGVHKGVLTAFQIRMWDTSISGQGSSFDQVHLKVISDGLGRAGLLWGGGWTVEKPTWMNDVHSIHPSHNHDGIQDDY
jgi:hypothetical protein